MSFLIVTPEKEENSAKMPLQMKYLKYWALITRFSTLSILKYCRADFLDASWQPNLKKQPPRENCTKELTSYLQASCHEVCSHLWKSVKDTMQWEFIRSPAKLLRHCGAHFLYNPICYHYCNTLFVLLACVTNSLEDFLNMFISLIRWTIEKLFF